MQPKLLAAGDVINPSVNGKIGSITDYGGALGLFLSNLIAVVIGFGGLFFFMNLILGGYAYITAGGDKEAVQRATGRIRNALIGMIVILSVYTIMYIIETMFSINLRVLNIPTIQ